MFKKIKILFFGDIVGKIGRKAIAQALPGLKKKFKPDLVVANGENLAHGSGMTLQTAREVLAAGVDLLTAGNHLKETKDFTELLTEPDSKVIRPDNYPPGLPGAGVKLLVVKGVKIFIVNLLGRVFLQETPDDPFRGLDKILEEHKESKKIVIVDFHAEATSEKTAFGWYAAGRVSAVLGTHTHVPTADSRILPGGTAYISDVGMVGAKEGVIGVIKEVPIKGFLTQTKQRFEPPEEGSALVNGVYLEIDSESGQTLKIERVDREVEI